MKEVLVVTGSRGEYGYIRPFLLNCKDNDSINADVLVTNMHLMPEHGLAVDNFKADGIKIKYKLFNTIAGNTKISATKSLFIFGLSLCDILENSNYDFILLAGDRGEQLIASISGFNLGIPVIHIQAGEVSGHVDGMSRHAIARFTHIHIAANQDASNRLINFGEQEFRVFKIGAPQLDEIYSHNPMSEKDFYCNFNINPRNKIILLAYHPTIEEIGHCFDDYIKIIKTLEKLDGYSVIAVYPNCDPGANKIIKFLDTYIRKEFVSNRNLSRYLYLETMRRAHCILGNSSSGLLEAPTFNTPCLNIGLRQKGRVRCSNVFDINAPLKEDELEKYLLKIPNKNISKPPYSDLNPYGDGNTTKKLIDIILSTKVNNLLMQKQITK